eukprot:469103-Amphidinium_carterae.1
MIPKIGRCIATSKTLYRHSSGTSCKGAGLKRHGLLGIYFRSVKRVCRTGWSSMRAQPCGSACARKARENTIRSWITTTHMT